MTIIAERVFRPVTKTIIMGVLLSFLIALVFYNLHIVAACIAFLVCCTIQGIRVYFIVQSNQDDTPPIYADGENIYCYNGKVILEFPVKDLYYAKGKHKKYFRIFGNFLSWGTYNYGEVKIYYDNDGRKECFAVKNVLEPEDAAIDLMQYADTFTK